MAIEKMALVNIAGLMDELDGALKKCCESGCFHIEPAGSGADGKMKALSEKNRFDRPLKNLSQLASQLGITLKQTDLSGCGLSAPEDFDGLFEKYNGRLSELGGKRQEITQRISELGAAQKQIVHLQGMHSDFQRLFSLKYVSVRIGKLPADNLPKLDYYDENFFFVPFETGKSFCWGMYFVPETDKVRVDEIFHSMYFERIMLPSFVSGDADEALAKITEQIKADETELDKINKGISAIAAEAEDELQQAFTKLRFIHDTFELRRNAAVLGDKFYLKGFIPEKEKERFDKLFEDTKSVSVVYLPADADASCEPPTILKNNFLTKPFTMLVEMYGLPDYKGFNPTAFVAVTYTLLFGIMFGDLGQGLLLFLGGLALKKKIGEKASGMAARIGLSSMIFGTLYGSFFGYEELLDPVFESIGIDFLPLKVFKQTNFILITAVAIGVALIVMSMILNIYIGFKNKDYEKAIFGCNGIAGLVFYCSVAAGLVGTLMFDVKIMSAPFVIFLIVIPFICIFCRTPFSIAVKYKQWKLSEDEENMTVGNFIVENFFEMFEFVLSYISNTMSFLRVGGFVLSHAGMMLVVMTLMDMCAAAAQPFVLVLGNLFVMVMEGMIVAIQIIRLEFYEIFSRFYEGGGKPFEPVDVKFSAQTE